MVEHHLAKVRVAGSNPVVRSEKVQFKVLVGTRKGSFFHAHSRPCHICAIPVNWNK